MKDAGSRILYIGKAKSVRERVASYFNASADLDLKTRAMIGQVREIEIIVTRSEIDALLTEARLIRDIQPKYNISLKDDKSFPFLAISFDKYPRVYITRERHDGTAEYFGPYTNSKELHDAVKLLQLIFKFRSCTSIIDQAPSKHRKRTCLMHSIGRCSGPCSGTLSIAEYGTRIRHLRRFLEKGSKQLLADLDREMKKSALDLDFETASHLRDQIMSLRGLTLRDSSDLILPDCPTPGQQPTALEELKSLFNLDADPRAILGIDISTTSGKVPTGSIVCFLDGAPFKAGYRRYKLKASGISDDIGMMKEVLSRRFGPAHKMKLPATEPPADIILIDGGDAHVEMAEAIIRKLSPGSRSIIVGLAKRRGDHLSSRALRKDFRKDDFAHAFRLLQHIRDEAHRFANLYHRKLRSRAFFEGIPAPARIRKKV